jgi:hypothetical protein
VHRYFGLGLLPLILFPYHHLIRFPSSIRKPERESRLLYTGRRMGVRRIQSMLIPGAPGAPDFDVVVPAFLQVIFSMRHQRFTCVRPSKPREFHPKLLTEPCLILSHLTARPSQESTPAFHRVLEALPVSGWPKPNCDGRSLRSSPITGPSSLL